MITAVRDVPPNVAVTVTGPLAVNAPAVAVKLPVNCPACRVTESGTVTLALSSDSVTVALDESAPESVTVQVDVPPAFNIGGVHDSELMVGVVVPPVVWSGWGYG